MVDDPQFRRAAGYLGYCTTCQKKSFVSRKAARRAARKANSGHMQAYVCPVSDGQWWHMGHLPAAVRRGEATKEEVYGTVSQFPKAKPTGNPKDKRKREPAARKPCIFRASGQINHRGVQICAECGGLRTEPQHDLPPTPDPAIEIDERRAP